MMVHSQYANRPHSKAEMKHARMIAVLQATRATTTVRTCRFYVTYGIRKEWSAMPTQA